MSKIHATIDYSEQPPRPRRENVDVKDDEVGFVRKYLSVDGLLSIVKHGLRREKFKVIKNTEYTWEDCIMSGLAVFGFKMPSLL